MKDAALMAGNYTVQIGFQKSKRLEGMGKRAGSKTKNLINRNVYDTGAGWHCPKDIRIRVTEV